MHPGLLLFDKIQKIMKNASTEAIRLLRDNDECIKKRSGHGKVERRGWKKGWRDGEQKDGERKKTEIEFD